MSSENTSVPHSSSLASRLLRLLPFSSSSSSNSPGQYPPPPFTFPLNDRLLGYITRLSPYPTDNLIKSFHTSLRLFGEAWEACSIVQVDYAKEKEKKSRGHEFVVLTVYHNPSRQIVGHLLVDSLPEYVFRNTGRYDCAKARLDNSYSHNKPQTSSTEEPTRADNRAQIFDDPPPRLGWFGAGYSVLASEVYLAGQIPLVHVIAANDAVSTFAGPYYHPERTSCCWYAAVFFAVLTRGELPQDKRRGKCGHMIKAVSLEEVTDTARKLGPSFDDAIDRTKAELEEYWRSTEAGRERMAALRRENEMLIRENETLITQNSDFRTRNEGLLKEGESLGKDVEVLKTRDEHLRSLEESLRRQDETLREREEMFRRVGEMEQNGGSWKEAAVVYIRGQRWMEDWRASLGTLRSQ